MAGVRGFLSCTSRTTLEALGVQALGTVILSAVAATGTPWSLAAGVLWLPAAQWAAARAAARAVAAGRSARRAAAAVWLVLLVGFLPGLAYFGAVAVDPWVAVRATVAVALVAVAGLALLLATSRRRSSEAPDEHVKRRRLLAAGLGLALLGVPYLVDAGLRQSLRNRIEACPRMVPYAAAAPQSTTRPLAEACAQLAGKPAVLGTSGAVTIEVYAGARQVDVRVVYAEAVSIVRHLTAALGPPDDPRITVSAVRMPGPVRGSAGPGFVLLDAAEITEPRGCAEFRRSAGTKGTCGAWVLAHELAHQWFPGAAPLGPANEQIAWEATADYLAWDWWRSRYGRADADRLTGDLFAGRVRLAAEFASSHAPVNVPLLLTDRRARALVRGRASLGLVAAEGVAGRGALMDSLRYARDAAADSELTTSTIIDAVGRVSPRAEGVLKVWWTRPAMPDLRSVVGR
ncbi:MAG TPA: hypothetical protein VHJ78_05530 [Actinomycetota bacterium]|nr:hypothetical protein [Actinomycetota bacterium]